MSKLQFSESSWAKLHARNLPHPGNHGLLQRRFSARALGAQNSPVFTSMRQFGSSGQQRHHAQGVHEVSHEFDVNPRDPDLVLQPAQCMHCQGMHLGCGRPLFQAAGKHLCQEKTPPPTGQGRAEVATACPPVCIPWRSRDLALFWVSDHSLSREAMGCQRAFCLEALGTQSGMHPCSPVSKRTTRLRSPKATPPTTTAWRSVESEAWEEDMGSKVQVDPGQHPCKSAVIFTAQP